MLENKIKEIRKGKENKYTQEKMAREIDITVRQYINIENNKSIPSVYIALKIADVLKCKVEDIYKIKKD